MHLDTRELGLSNSDDGFILKKSCGLAYELPDDCRYRMFGFKYGYRMRNPEKGLIVHSDRGSQYASQKYPSLLASHGFIGSMRRKDDCWDNSVAESFFSRLKDECVFWRNYQTRDEAKNNILNDILMFYNSQQLDFKLGYVSPQQFENNYCGAIAKAA